MSDKRDYFRMLINSEVTMQYRNGETEVEVKANLIDLSASGLSIRAKESIEQKTLVNATVPAYKNMIPEMNMRGSVVRSVKDSDGEFNIAIKAC
jgi:c-di-GMP-binding flagellar brake protein YcgR